MILQEKNLVFGPGDKYKTFAIKNVTGEEKNACPLMFKVKSTNIQLIDSKPSYGYVSAADGSNELQITIKCLKQIAFEAKIQVCYLRAQNISQKQIIESHQSSDTKIISNIFSSKKQEAKAVYLNIKKAISIPPNQNLEGFQAKNIEIRNLKQQKAKEEEKEKVIKLNQKREEKLGAAIMHVDQKEKTDKYQIEDKSNTIQYQIPADRASGEKLQSNTVQANNSNNKAAKNTEIRLPVITVVIICLLVFILGLSVGSAWQGWADPKKLIQENDNGTITIGTITIQQALSETGAQNEIHSNSDHIHFQTDETNPLPPQTTGNNSQQQLTTFVQANDQL